MSTDTIRFFIAIEEGLWKFLQQLEIKNKYQKIIIYDNIAFLAKDKVFYFSSFFVCYATCIKSFQRFFKLNFILEDK